MAGHLPEGLNNCRISLHWESDRLPQRPILKLFLLIKWFLISFAFCFLLLLINLFLRFLFIVFISTLFLFFDCIELILIGNCTVYFLFLCLCIWSGQVYGFSSLL